MRRAAGPSAFYVQLSAFCVRFSLSAFHGRLRRRVVDVLEEVQLEWRGRTRRRYVVVIVVLVRVVLVRVVLFCLVVDPPSPTSAGHLRVRLISQLPIHVSLELSPVTAGHHRVLVLGDRCACGTRALVEGGIDAGHGHGGRCGGR